MDAVFRAQVALMRRFTHEDVWGDLSVREYDVLFTLSRCEGRAARLRDLGAESLLFGYAPETGRLFLRLTSTGLTVGTSRARELIGSAS